MIYIPFAVYFRHEKVSRTDGRVKQPRRRQRRDDDASTDPGEDASSAYYQSNLPVHAVGETARERELVWEFSLLA